MTLIFTGGIKPKGKVSFGTKDLPPVWQTAAGLLGSFSELTSINEMLLAIDPNDDTVTYSIFSGSLPGGLSLASNGTISGDADDVVSTTTFNFTVKAIDSSFNHLSTTRSFSIEIQNIAAGNEIFNAAGTFTHIVELAVTSIEGKCWGGGGASGRSSFSGPGGTGGGGGYASSILSVTPGQSVTIKVGGRGEPSPWSGRGGPGGGASDIRFGATRQIIAAGGGGGGRGHGTNNTYGGNGGAGGGSIGITGSNTKYSQGIGGGGGTQSAGGEAGSGGGSPTAGSAFYGGTGSGLFEEITDGGFNGGGGSRRGGGGGGGLFGGGGGGGFTATSSPAAGGGGGSSQGTTKTSGSGVNAGNNGDEDYASNAGLGGAQRTSGSNSGNSGRVVINWGPGI